MSRILGMMRIKNEERWIERVLRSMAVCDRIFVFDDHSTDETVRICEQFQKVYLIRSPFDGSVQETRDKNHLIEIVEAYAKPGDWILHLDGDEELRESSVAAVKFLADNDKGVGPDAYRFKILYLWDDEDHVRIDGIYNSYTRGSFFRFTKGARFHSAVGGGFHCGNVPDCKQMMSLPSVEVLHYGYMYREDRLRKFEWYNSPDKQPIPPSEDGYRHMVIGDVFPAETKTYYAGPLMKRLLNA